MAHARWSGSPSRLYSSELSDGMIQSVKLRASGGDTFVQPVGPTTPVARQQQHVKQQTIGAQAAATAPPAQAYEEWTSQRPAEDRTTQPGVRTAQYHSGAADIYALPAQKRGETRRLDQDNGSKQQSDQAVMAVPLGVAARFAQPSHGISTASAAGLSSLSLFSGENTHEANNPYSSAANTTTVTPGATRGTESLSSLPSSTRAASSTTSRTKTKRVRVKTVRRREQCRTNQARYRNKQRTHRLELEGAVMQLRDEVSRLEAQYRFLAYERRTNASSWNVVVEYFRLFRRGAIVRFPDTARSRTNASYGRREPLTDSTAPSASLAVDLFLQSPGGQEQIAFLKSGMLPEVYYGGGTEETQGIEGIADLWIRLARCFDDFELQLDRMVKVPGYFDTIMTVTRAGVTVSEATLREVFPHLLSQCTPGSRREEGRSADENGLARRLLGQRLEFKCVSWFDCDRESSKVVRLRTQMDLVTPIMRALGSLTDTAQVLDGARMTNNGFILDE